MAHLNSLTFQEKFDELLLELDSTKLDLEHAQLSSKENEAAAQALRYEISFEHSRVAVKCRIAISIGCKFR